MIIQEKLTGIAQTNGGLAAFGGGLPIYRDSKLIGAIGVSGATASEDEEIARQAINTLMGGTTSPHQ